MPNVGGKKFPYSASGIKAAKRFAKSVGKAASGPRVMKGPMKKGKK